MRSIKVASAHAPSVRIFVVETGGEEPGWDVGRSSGEDDLLAHVSGEGEHLALARCDLGFERRSGDLGFFAPWAAPTSFVLSPRSGRLSSLGHKVAASSSQGPHPSMFTSRGERREASSWRFQHRYPFALIVVRGAG